jgi:hypothetical protein
MPPAVYDNRRIEQYPYGCDKEKDAEDVTGVAEPFFEQYKRRSAGRVIDKKKICTERFIEKVYGDADRNQEQQAFREILIIRPDISPYKQHQGICCKKYVLYKALYADKAEERINGPRREQERRQCARHAKAV